MQTKRNIAARAGRWSAQHRKKAIFGWLAFVVIAFAIGGAIGTKTLGNTQTSRIGESGRADAVLRDTFKQNYSEQVLVQARRGTAVAQVRSGVRDVVKRISATGNATNIRSPYAAGNHGQLSKDGRSAIVTFEVAGTKNDKQYEHIDKVDPLLKATAAARRAHPSLRIEQSGDASIQKAVEKRVGEDLGKATSLSLPITLAILVLAFGALAAAGVPMLLAITSVLATFGLVAIPSQIAPVDTAAGEVVLLIGMAVGVDYALFYLRREREERAAGKSPDAALEAAAATSGRSVLVSGLTVMTAMAGMYFTGDATFESYATAAIIVVAVAVLGSLTVLPAILSKLGDKVMKGRVPIIGRRREQGQSRIWSAVLGAVLRRPKASALLATGVLVAMSIPAFGMKTGNAGVDSLPQDLAAAKALKHAQAAFPGTGTPAQVVVQASNVKDPSIRSEIERLQSRALASGKFDQPTQVDTSSDGKAAVVSLPIAVGSGTDEVSNDAVEALRGELVPQTVGKVATANVTGLAAQSVDFNDHMGARAPIVFAFVLAVAFVLLLVTFRSIVIPIKAIVLNLLSVGAAYGVLVQVFQKGWLESALGFQSTGMIESWLPVFLFVILFGLSMDYQVFIVSRIREAFDRGMTTDDAVEHGIKSTATVVTSAAMVMVAVFAIFGSLSLLMLKQMGVGLAVAIFIDATIVRAVLLPASMKLLGDWNWYLPKRLEWLPKVRLEHEVHPEPAKA
ncbi:MAG TPA: MMPL family transporter [Thermoleophilaceae bacterium]